MVPLVAHEHSAQLLPETVPDVSIVVPTLREVANVPFVARRVDAAMAGRAYELIFVDDNSRDGTVEACAVLRDEGLPVTLIVRTDRRAGLSGAVLTGLAAARGAWLVVMDADLQHPPERIPALLDAIEDGGAEFALGSRYVEGGGVADAWGTFRRLNSRVATLLAAPFARGIRDPMSGFFAIPRAVYERGTHVAPTGYKIALELLCKCRAQPVGEVPIRFALRERGQSKLSFKEQLRYLEHLSRLYDFAFPRAVPILKFIITVSGALLVASLWFTAFIAGDFRPTWLIATASYFAGSMLSAVFHLRYVRAERAFLIRRRPWMDFFVCTFAELIAVAITAAYLVHRIAAITPAELLLLPFAVGTAVRYAVRKELLLDVRGLRYVPSYRERLAGTVPALVDRDATSPRSEHVG